MTFATTYPTPAAVLRILARLAFQVGREPCDFAPRERLDPILSVSDDILSRLVRQTPGLAEITSLSDDDRRLLDEGLLSALAAKIAGPLREADGGRIGSLKTPDGAQVTYSADLLAVAATDPRPGWLSDAAGYFAAVSLVAQSNLAAAAASGVLLLAAGGSRRRARPHACGCLSPYGIERLLQGIGCWSFVETWDTGGGGSAFSVSVQPQVTVTVQDEALPYGQTAMEYYSSDAGGHVSFTATSGLVTSANGVPTVLLVLSNPSGSGKVLHVDTVELGGNQGGIIQIYNQPDAHTGGVPYTPRNRSAGSPVSVAQVWQGNGSLSITGGAAIRTTFIADGGDSDKNQYGGASMIQPGQTRAYVYVPNGQASGAADLSWWELPV